MITQNRLKELFYYNPETGIFSRLSITNRNQHIGDIVGCEDIQKGYIMIGADGALYLAHRLAFLYMTGEWPKNQIDHINRIKNDNRWCNLREATPRQNGWNKKVPKNNKVGIKGVYWDKRISKFIVQRDRRYLGSFASKEQAALASLRYAKQHHGEFLVK